MRKMILSMVVIVFSATMVFSEAFAEKADDADTDSTVKTDKAADADVADEAKDLEIVEKPVKKSKPAKAAKADKKTKADKKDVSVKTADETKAVKNEIPVCPDSVEVAPQSLAKKLPNWRNFTNTEAKYWLEMVTVYVSKSGKLERFEPANGSETFSKWLLSDNSKDKYYLVCGYTHTSLLIKQPLDEKLQKCRVEFAQNPHNPNGPETMTKFSCE